MIELPLWAEEIRPTQVTAIQEILDAYSSGHSVAVLDAPTGAGKTLIGEMVRQSLGARAVYLCSSISLQEQFIRDFPKATLLKGRSNYATADSPARYPELTAADCNKVRVRIPACRECDPGIKVKYESLHCNWCHPVTACPYEEAKADAIRSDLVCTNTAYFLYESNYVGNISMGRQLIIVDEADLLEDALMSFVGVQISNRRAKDLDIQAPLKKTVESAWVEWGISAQQHLKKVRESGRFSGNTVDAIRQRNSLDLLRDSIKRLNDNERGLSAGGWVYTGYDKGDIAFRPVTIDTYAREYLWKHCSRWLLMSATTISFPVMMQSLGL